MKASLVIVLLGLALASQALAFQRILVDAPDTEEGLWWAARDVASLLSLSPEAVLPFEGQFDDSDLLIAWPESAHWGAARGLLPADLDLAKLGQEGFALVPEGEGALVVGFTRTGALYGLLELRQRLDDGRPLFTAKVETFTPMLRYRGQAGSFPFWLGTTMYANQWSGYGPTEQTTDWWWFDEANWRGQFQELARGRQNALVYWHPHPYPALVTVPGYPEAQYFSPELQEAYRKQFHWILETAAQYGVRIYLLTWNICLTPKFAEAQNVPEFGADTPLVRDYTKQAVKALFTEYPDLGGLMTMAAETPPNCIDFVREALVGGLNELEPRPLLVFWTWCSYPDQAKALLDEYQGPSEVMHYLQYEQLFSDQVDPRVRMTADAVGRDVVCLGGLGTSTAWQYWCDLPFLQRLLADLPEKRGSGSFFQGLDSFEWLGSKWLAREALGRFQWDATADWPDSLWKAKLARKYGSPELADALWTAMTEGSGILLRFVQLVHSQTDHYHPYIGLPLVNLVAMPTIETYVFENHDYVSEDGLMHPNMGLTWPNPDWGIRVMGVAEYAQSLADGTPPRATTPLEVADELATRAQTTLTALEQCDLLLEGPEEAEATEARKICALLHMNCYLGNHFAAKLRAAVAWECWRLGINPEENKRLCLSELDTSLAAWRKLADLGWELHPGEFTFWRSEVNLQPPWDHMDLWTGYQFVKGNFRTQLPYFERERALIAERLEGNPKRAALPLWMELAEGVEVIQPLLSWDFEEGFPDALPEAQARRNLTTDPDEVLGGKQSAKFDARGFDHEWVMLVMMAPEAAKLERGKTYRLDFDYLVLDTGGREQTNLGVAAHTDTGGWERDLGTNRFIRARQGQSGHWFIQFTPEEFDDYRIFWSSQYPAEVVLDNIKLAEVKPLEGQSPERGEGGAPW